MDQWHCGSRSRSVDEDGPRPFVVALALGLFLAGGDDVFYNRENVKQLYLAPKLINCVDTMTLEKVDDNLIN